MHTYEFDIIQVTGCAHQYLDTITYSYWVGLWLSHFFVLGWSLEIGPDSCLEYSVWICVHNASSSAWKLVTAIVHAIFSKCAVMEPALPVHVSFSPI
jgi:hypothetical protein